ncbi:hypothetical protein D3C71_1762630 [compost metagenome]
MGRIISTVMGMLKAMCDSSTDIKPSLIPTIVNSTRKDAPIITSGLTISTLFRDRSVLRVRLRLTETIASAPLKPNMVAIADDSKASTTVLITIIISRVSWNTSLYHCRVNPSKLRICPPLLKE